MSAHLSAIDLLKLGDEDRTKPFLNQIWPYVIGVPFGIGSGIMMNFGTRRPIFSGIQKHILGVAGWCALLNYVQNKRNEYFAEKDAVYRHYVELHPEDFPIPERKKLADVFEPWVPIR
ncbi:NADH dehydrogenase [ubiquinone] 1 subunit C2 [Papilio xuthus]|uniref:NADH dehydrogenase [ubiquinone] 1 subunit C2 n=1 Tax=Papilio xuthus TaxID=66420 RepID=A0A194PUY6_PAPXU|nr:NADH dehydrogenase [ubiquinone] 1 subunit C2 [Papilio xuthus]